MKRSFYICLVSIIFGLLSVDASAQQKGADLDTLLKQVREGKVRESKENAAREQEFKRNKVRQQQMLADAKRGRARLEKKSAEMEDQFDANEVTIGEQTELLNKRMGSLKELFGILQQGAGDARATFENSFTNIQYPDRSEFLIELAEKMGSATKLASLEEIERLWFEIQREMTESGKIIRFKGNVVVPGGDEVQKDVIRIGVFSLVADGKYLRYDTATDKISELLRQPKDHFVATAEELSSARSGIVNFGMDPTRGQLLNMLVLEPSWVERATTQGGPVGWIIIFLGGFAFFIALIKSITLALTSMEVTAQRRNLNNPTTGNPLGRVIKVYNDNKNIDVESLELKMGEAVLKEVPKINAFNTLLKVIAVVAPLLGLLGTVTGMILTFQQITLFGTGDPRMMAGGISTALVTTMLGLCVAIPAVFLYAMVAGRSKRIVEILEEQATGLVAAASEKQHSTA